MKAPKQMRHWMEANGFRLLRYKKKAWRDYPVAITRNHRFCQGAPEPYRLIRVLPLLGIMEICDGDFDRWANSIGARVPMPNTKDEFEKALDVLIDKSKPFLVIDGPFFCNSNRGHPIDRLF